MSKTSNLSAQAIAVLLLLCAGVAVLFGEVATRTASSYIREAARATDAESERRTSPYTVVIDAGHGGEDGGTQSAEGAYEKHINLRIAQLLNDMLKGCGIPTVMTREEDILLYDPQTDYQGKKKMLDLAARRKIAQETEDALFVSIHMNSFPETQYHGLQVFYSPNHPSSYTAASAIQTRARQWLDMRNDRKVKAATSAIYLLDRLECPAVLVECGFLSNPQEAALFETEEHQKKVAFTIFCALLEYISQSDA